VTQGMKPWEMNDFANADLPSPYAVSIFFFVETL